MSGICLQMFDVTLASFGLVNDVTGALDQDEMERWAAKITHSKLKSKLWSKLTSLCKIGG